MLLNDGLLQLAEKDKTINELFEGRLPEITDSLNKYISEIELFNSAYGLVNYKTKDELVIKHILDSLAPLGILRRMHDNSKNSAANAVPALHFADAGSGAGLPGIPLAIAMPYVRWTLIERMERRANFLRATCAILNLTNVEVSQNDVETLKNTNFDLITFRAFTPLESNIINKLFALLKKDAVIAAYKGRMEKINTELNSLDSKKINYHTEDYEVPFLDASRRMVILTKN
ncbi:MAG: 16S rRNA (guanine(527)-N(7))-methyltransferase RsmG [Spirochaetaceae bacterium]|nr:16S rRNA (guanine(527)-N(7))-methyltransferase RsmG [Spirochaetaceae bacterium]